MIGNKSDLPAVVSESNILEFADENKMEYFALSSLNEKKFQEIFEKIFEIIVKLVPVFPKPEQLMKKNIIIGKKLLQSSKYQLVFLLGVVRFSFIVRVI